MAKKKFYVTTAIDYVNASPHVGHAYQKVIADVLARWHKINGEKVFFLTGTDEHGQKIQRNAEKTERSPKEFCDEMSKKFKTAWRVLEVGYDRFIRTTDKDHEKLVKEFVEKVNSKGDIYKGEYSGYYCVDCETFYTERDLVNNNECPIHHKKCDLLKEETYYFRLSRYQDKLLKLYEKNPEFIFPKERRNEIINRVKEGLRDLSITRTSFDWGIPFPLDKKHVIYVWFDALINYITGAGKNQEFWPADVHLLGKDNGWFHAVIWPAMLISAGYKLPKTVFIHGFLTFNGEKISKSLGNSISPVVLVDKYCADSVRYYICRQIPFASGEDGDFSEQTLVDRHNNELANKLGNLVSRVSALIEKENVKECNNRLIKKLKLKEVENHMQNYELDKALNLIFEFIDACNEYVQNKKPWEVKVQENSGEFSVSPKSQEKKILENKKVLYELADSIKAIAILLWPFIPNSSEKLAKQFKFEIDYKNIKMALRTDGLKSFKKGEILFKKI